MFSGLRTSRIDFKGKNSFLKVLDSFFRVQTQQGMIQIMVGLVIANNSCVHTK